MREVGVGTVDVKVNAVTMEDLVWCMSHWIAEGTDFHRIGHGCFGYGRGGIRVVPRLSRSASVFIFVKLLCPVCSLVCDKTVGWSCKSDGSVWGLEFWHVSRVPPHFRFGSEPQDQFGLIRGGYKVGYIDVRGVETVEDVHGIVVQRGGDTAMGIG